MEHQAGKIIMSGLDMRIDWSRDYLNMQLQYRIAAIESAIEKLHIERVELYQRMIVEAVALETLSEV